MMSISEAVTYWHLGAVLTWLTTTNGVNKIVDHSYHPLLLCVFFGLLVTGFVFMVELRHSIGSWDIGAG